MSSLVDGSRNGELVDSGVTKHISWVTFNAWVFAFHSPVHRVTEARVPSLPPVGDPARAPILPLELTLNDKIKLTTNGAGPSG